MPSIVSIEDTMSLNFSKKKVNQPHHRTQVGVGFSCSQSQRGPNLMHMQHGSRAPSSTTLQLDHTEGASSLRRHLCATIAEYYKRASTCCSIALDTLDHGQIHAQRIHASSNCQNP